MERYVAFLRGMNLGRRRITNDNLCICFTGMGFSNVSAFLTSGNVIFDATRTSTAKVATTIEEGLRTALTYEVPTFLRTAKEVRAIASYVAFSEDEVARTKGKPQVAMLSRRSTTKVRAAIESMATPEDRLVTRDRELYWLPSGSLLESNLDLKAIESALGPMTIRTRRTVERIAAKHLAD